MNDHAETILQALHLLGPDPVDDEAELHEGQLHGYEALRLLVAERDEARRYERHTAQKHIALRNAVIRNLTYIRTGEFEREDDSTLSLLDDIENALGGDGSNPPKMSDAEIRAEALEAVLADLLPWAGKQTFENDAVWINARAALQGRRTRTGAAS